MYQSPGTKFALLSGLTLLFGVTSWAQITTGAITGQVVDPTNAPVPGAAVELTNVATESVRNTTTNSAGEYTFAFVPLGPYSVKVQAKGFQSVLHSDIRVQVNVTARVDVTLQTSVVREMVEVTGTP